MIIKTILFLILISLFLSCKTTTSNTTRILNDKGQAVGYIQGNRVLDTKGKTIYYIRKD